jgi:hypothetical protein
MSGTISEQGYLEDTYLTPYSYLSGQIQNAICAQVEMKINDQVDVNTQVEMRVFDESAINTQTEMRIVDKLEPINTQVDMRVFKEDDVNTQVEMRIVDPTDDPILNTQVEMQVKPEIPVNTQVEMRIVDEDDDFIANTQVDMQLKPEQGLPSQVEMKRFIESDIFTQVDMRLFATPSISSQIEMKIIDIDAGALPMQVKIGQLAHYICGGYLTQPYLEEPYLAYRMCAHLGTQVDMRNFVLPPINTQVDRRIVDPTDDPIVFTQVEMRIKERGFPTFTQVDMRRFTDTAFNTQVDRRIVDVTDDPHVLTQVEMRIQERPFPFNMQVNMLKSEKLNAQVTMVIYNITQLRLLCNFISRGTEALGGNNWVSVQAVSPGDYSPNNLNTDIVEQRTQTPSVNLWQLRCNTGNPNSFVDTIGILNHNFSRGATVEVAGSDDPAFGTIKFSYPMTVEDVNMYYIAPTLPNIPAQYYQFTISDPGNSEGILKIGTIVFGSGIIMTRKEQFLNPVTYGFRHYKDTLETEGFTSVSNDRALRKFLNLTYAQLVREGGNFRALRQYILDAKTDLKCLIIPRPTVPSALAVFAKMSQLPEEQHNAIDDNNWRIDMTFDWDESL